MNLWKYALLVVMATTAVVLCVPRPSARAQASGEGRPFGEERDESIFRERIPGMVFVQGGCFTMGCGSWTQDCSDDESPAHEVCVEGFYLDSKEVSQADYAKVAPNPSFHVGPKHPAESVNWTEAKEYCEKLGKRLPTEAEWEYAARSRGKNHIWAGTNDIEEVLNYAWYSRYSGSGGEGTHHVGTLRPNGLLLYDMTGNVWEWVSDRYSPVYYKTSPRMSPRGASEGEMRVVRGGAWFYRASAVRTTARYGVLAGTRQDDIGFRCARSAE